MINDERLTITSMMDAQMEFEHERGIHTLNTPEYGLMRIGVELDEAYEALREGSRMDVLREVVDVMIFGTSVLAHLAQELDMPFEQVEEGIRFKMAQNHVKYDKRFFNNGWHPEEAIEMARYHWNNNIPIPDHI